MFLSALVSRYHADGSLEVDLREHDGPLVRFGPFAAGMPWYRWRSDGCIETLKVGKRSAAETEYRWRSEGWVETAFDWGARLVNRAHESRCDLPVLRYLQGWPRDLIGTLEPIWHAQTSVMQLCALHPAARDLAHANAILLWLAGARYAEEAGWRERLPRLLALPQRELLAAVLDRPQVRPAQVRLLRKVVLMDGRQSTLGQIRDLVRDEEAVLALSHWRRLPSSLIPLVRGRLLGHLNWLRDQLGDTADRWLLGEIVEPRLDLLRDTSRMLEGYPRRGTDRLVTQFCRDWAGVQRVHDALITMGGGDDGSNFDPSLAFGPPPIPSNDQFQAITTVGELREEGRRMRHCVATRAEDVLAGGCYIYRVRIRGERGTLQVGIKPQGLVIDEFRLRGNTDPSPAAWAAAQAWFEGATTGGCKDART